MRNFWFVYRRLLMALVVLVSATAVLAHQSSAQEATSRRSAAAETEADDSFTLTAEQIANPPERKLEFDENSGSAEMPLRRAEPSLLEKKYVASFALELPPQNAFPGELKELNRLQDFGHSYLLYPHHHSGPGVVDDPIGETLRRILGAMPADKRPTADEIEFLQHMPVEIQVGMSQTADGGGWVRDFTIFAESSEGARSRAATLLKILDNGLTRAYQMELFGQRTRLLQDIAAEQKELERATEELEQLRKEAAEIAEFPGEVLPNLRVQQMQLEVDLAGTKSRIEACQKLLEGERLSGDRREKVIDLRTAAEVDLASFEARQTTITRFIGKAKRSLELDGLLKEKSILRSRRQQSLGQKNRKVRSLEAMILSFQPLPLVDKIRIQPLKWTQ